jgi:hypothetical protein
MSVVRVVHRCRFCMKQISKERRYYYILLTALMPLPFFLQICAIDKVLLRRG